MFAVVKIDLLILFILLRAHEYENLLIFINFQRKLRLQNLNVERDNFRRLEKKANRLFIIAAIVFLIPNCFFIFGRELIEWDIFFKTSVVYFEDLNVIAFCIYNSTSLQLFYEMYHYHRMAYNTHIRSYVGLFIATQLSIILMIALGGYNLFAAFCLSSESDLDLDDSSPNSICDVLGTLSYLK